MPLSKEAKLLESLTDKELEDYAAKKRMERYKAMSDEELDAHNARVRAKRSTPEWFEKQRRKDAAEAAQPDDGRVREQRLQRQLAERYGQQKPARKMTFGEPVFDLPPGPPTNLLDTEQERRQIEHGILRSLPASQPPQQAPGLTPAEQSQLDYLLAKARGMQ